MLCICICIRVCVCMQACVYVCVLCVIICITLCVCTHTDTVSVCVRACTCKRTCLCPRWHRQRRGQHACSLRYHSGGIYPSSFVWNPAYYPQSVSIWMCFGTPIWTQCVFWESARNSNQSSCSVSNSALIFMSSEFGTIVISWRMYGKENATQGLKSSGIQ